MPYSLIANLMSNNMLSCKYNGKGCGHEDGCTLTQNQAEQNCSTYKYMVCLDEFWDNKYNK